MAVELDYDPFIEDLRSHFGYSHDTHVLLWDHREHIDGLDCEYAIRTRNGWLGALIALQNKEAVAGHGLTCRFFIVTKNEFGRAYLPISQPDSDGTYRIAQKAPFFKDRRKAGTG
jgi:hypothetical protein